MHLAGAGRAVEADVAEGRLVRLGVLGGGGQPNHSLLQGRRQHLTMGRRVINHTWSEPLRIAYHIMRSYNYDIHKPHVHDPPFTQTNYAASDWLHRPRRPAPRPQTPRRASGASRPGFVHGIASLSF